MRRFDHVPCALLSCVPRQNQRRSTLFPYTTLFRSGRRDAPADDHTVQVRREKLRGAHVVGGRDRPRSEEHTSELQSQFHLVCRLLLEKKNHWDFPRLGIEGGERQRGDSRWGGRHYS